MSSPQYGLLSIVLAIAIIAGVSDGHPPQKIIGGIMAETGEFPYQVALFRKDRNKYYCGGAIIDERHVLTAAQCVDFVSPPYNGITVMTGSATLNDGEIHHVESITCHEEFDTVDEYAKYDIAIITLTENIIFNENQTSVALASADDEPSPGGDAMANVTGWGYVYAGGNFISPQLKKTIPLILTNEQCLKDPFVQNMFNKSTQICGLNRPLSGPYACDNGGPLVYNGHIIGIVSSYYGWSRESPDLYTRVSHFLPWIRKHIPEIYPSKEPFKFNFDEKFQWIPSGCQSLIYGYEWLRQLFERNSNTSLSE